MTTLIDKVWKIGSIVWLVVLIALVLRILPDQVRGFAGFYLAVWTILYLGGTAYQSWRKRKNPPSG